MELKVKLNLKDYQQFNRAFILRSLKRFTAFFYIFVFFIIAIFIFIYGSGSLEPEIQDLQPAPFNIRPFLLIGVVVSIPFYYKRYTKKYFESNPLLKDEQRYQLSKDFIEISSERGYTKLSWLDINRVEFYKWGYAIFTSTNQANIIPKRIFIDNETEEEFKILLRNSLPIDKIIK